MNLLSCMQAQIQIVMINTTLPANIGSASRAMWTMGLSNLVLVDPKLPIDDTSYANSAGGSHLLDKAKVVNSLDKAIGHSQLVFAASSRRRSVPRPVINPAQSAQVMSNFLSSLNKDSGSTSSSSIVSEPVISILFGREDRGLTNEELAVADYHIQIDANPAYPVLNVASAVQVISSFIYSHFYQCQQQADAHSTAHSMTKSTADEHQLVHHIRQDWDEPAISHQQQTQLNARIVELMQSLELADKDDLRLLPQRLSRLTSRLQLDTKEYQLINAVLGRVEHLNVRTADKQNCSRRGRKCSE